ncbi:MAG: AEC family transporter [Rhodospirillales bacterium]|nr:AEC family transporter [Rhodospirillales bacterium]
MIGELLTIMIPVVVCVSIGFGWAKLGYAFDSDMMARMVTSVGLPALVLSALTGTTLSPPDFATTGLAAVGVLIVMLALSWVVLKVAGLDRRAFLPAVSFSNFGNMGLPLSVLAFGDIGIAFGVTFFAIHNVAMFALGGAIASGRSALRGLVELPVLCASLVAVAFIVTGTTPPAWLTNSVKLISGLVVPLMLIGLGVALARLRFGSFGRSLFLSSYRLGAGFAVGVAVAWAVGLQGPARGILILQSSMPVAVFNYILAERYRTAPGEVAGLVLLSTLLSFATLPLLLWYVL